jgi:hypothetical protein
LEETAVAEAAPDATTSVNASKTDLPLPVDSASASDGAKHSGAFAHLPAKFLDEELRDAELMLSYAVETGADVDPDVYLNILEARSLARTGWTEDTAVKLLEATATLAAKLKPVTAASLRRSANSTEAHKAIRGYRPAAVILALVVIIYSALTFLTSNLSTKIRSSLDIANPLAVKLIDELGPPQSTNPLLCQNRVPFIAPQPESPIPDTGRPPVLKVPNKSVSSQLPSAVGKPTAAAEELPAGIHRKDVIQDLQQFATAIRDMYGNAQQINRISRHFFFQVEAPDPFRSLGSQELTEVLELPPGLPKLAQAATERVCVYQRVRYYAQSTEELVTLFSGAFATCILPVLYALLGVCAYLLRRFEDQLSARTLADSDAHGAHFITAAIACAVVGLFNFGQGASVSPLAIAFLVGYAVDVFFSFLQGLIQALSRVRDNAPAQGTAAARKSGFD